MSGRRIDATQVPWWLVVAGMLLALVTALAAAWWPARAVARIPITQALSARLRRPRPVRGSALVAVALVVIGFVVLGRALEDEIEPDDVPIVAGILMLALGFLLICRTAVRLLPPIAGRLPVAALGDPPALVPSRTSTELAQMEAAVEQLAETLDDATVVPLDAVVDPRATPDAQVYGGTDGLPSDLLAELRGDDVYESHMVHVATPEVLAWAGIDPASLDPEVDVSTPLTGGLIWLPGLNGRARVVFEGFAPETLAVQHIDGPGHISPPTSFVTPESPGTAGVHGGPGRLAGRGRRPAHRRRTGAGPGGGDPDRAVPRVLPGTRGDRHAADGRHRDRPVDRPRHPRHDRGVAAQRGRRRPPPADRDGGIEPGAPDDHRRHRSRTGVPRGGAGHGWRLHGARRHLLHDLAPLGQVPVVHLAFIPVGLPVAAAVAGWLLAGREPPALTRQPT
jgi:putative ABC transport system permease protein